MKDRPMCECNDPKCPRHPGYSSCTELATVLVVRTDMDDRTGLAMCDVCAEDAVASGVFCYG